MSKINTFGSSDRKFQGTTSQTIQLSSEVIDQLKRIIDSEF